jgi:ElaB/YqjD/DUF883 family membrane-anchored ribosome-binding protein
MSQIIEVPGHGQVEFPDGMTDAQIVAAIKRNHPREINQAAMNPEAETPFGTVKGETSTGLNPAAMLIKAGSALDSINKGILQAKLGPGDWLRQQLGGQPNELLQSMKAEQQSNKPAMEDLQAVHPGSAVLGDLLAAGPMPWRALPIVAGAEYGSPMERIEKAGAALVGGKLAEKGGQLASRMFAKSEANATRAAATNAVKDEGIAAAQDLGYKTVPSISNGSLTGRVIEGMTGKEKAKQLAAVQNQPITDALARKAMGLPETAPLSMETTKAVRAEAAKTGYEPVRQIPRMETDAIYQREASQLTSRADNAAKDFGDLVKSDIQPLADGLKNVKSFTGDSAVDAVATFREKASDLYAGGNKTLGKAYRQAAEMIEAQIERQLPKESPVLQNYRAARARMAQSFDLEKALREGQGTVDARVLGKLWQKNPDRMTGELAQIGRSAAAMPEVMAVHPRAHFAPFLLLAHWRRLCHSNSPPR